MYHLIQSPAWISVRTVNLRHPIQLRDKVQWQQNSSSFQFIMLNNKKNEYHIAALLKHNQLSPD